MRAAEFIVEAVSRANDIDHFRARVKQVVQLLEPIADHPLVYREFRHTIGAETAVLKVSNTGRTEFAARSGSNPKQPKLLQALGIENPVFCTMSTPGTTQGFFGGANIFVPGANYRVVWSPVVKDLGGNDVVGPDSDRYGHTDLGGGVSQGPSPDRQVGAEFADTYRSGWPSGYTDNELIFDCKSYYLLNIKDFLRRFAGRQNRDIVNARSRYSDINQEVFNAKFKTYGDIVWYLSNTLPKYLDWYEANVVAKHPAQPSGEKSLQEYRDDDGVWQHIARKLGAEWGGSAMESVTESYDTEVFRMAKLQKDGRVVRILKHQDQVSFSDEQGWLLIDVTPGRQRPETMKWIPDTTRFDWVREFRSAVDENFADGRVKGKSRPGRVKKAGASCAGSVSSLRAKARKYGGERGKMYHWCANMKGGKK